MKPKGIQKEAKSVRMYPAVWAALEKVANSCHRTVAQYIRLVVEEAINKQKKI